MKKNGLYLVALLSIIVTFTVIPAYAEVTALKTNAPFYKGGSKIYFSGTTLNTDPPNVTILIFDPNDKFVMLTSEIADGNHQFQVVVDTSIPDNQQKLSLKGVYNATAFIAKKESGKTASFVFSPDGSPIAPSSPTSLTASTRSSTEIDLSWSGPANNGGSSILGYKIERNDGNGFNLIQNTQSTSYQDTGLTPNKQYSYRVSAMNSAGTSDPTNIATTITLSSSTPTPPAQTPNSATDQGSGPSLDELLKQRLEAAQRLQELLHGKTSNSPTQPTISGKQQSVNLNESVGLGDTAPTNLEAQKSNGMPENNLTLGSFTNFDIKNILYPAISLVGVGIVVTILYFRKKRKLTSNTIKTPQEAQFTVEQTSEKQDDDYAMMIIKNRLAKGEITIDEFKILKDELSEP